MKKMTASSACTLSPFFSSVERQALKMAEFSTHNREDALDITQDSMLKFSQAYSQHDSAQWRPLFFRVLQNQMRDWHRRHKIRQQWRVWFHPDDHSHMIDEHGSRPEKELRLSESGKQLQQAIQTLSKRQQLRKKRQFFKSLPAIKRHKLRQRWKEMTPQQRRHWLKQQHQTKAPLMT